MTSMIRMAIGRRRLGWVMLIVCLPLLLLLALGVWLHELAVTRWPRLVIAWSPSADHVMRAALYDSRANPAGVDMASIAGATRRFSIRQLAQGLGRNPGRDARIQLFVAARADGGTLGSELTAVEMLSQWTTDLNPMIRCGWMTFMERVPPGILPKTPGLVRDSHPMVKWCALNLLRRRPSSAEVPIGLVDSIAECLDQAAGPESTDLRTTAGSRFGISGGAGTDWVEFMASDGEPPMRPLDVAEREILAGWIRDAAFRALSSWEPSRAVSEITKRWPFWNSAQRNCVFSCLDESPEPFVALLCSIAMESPPKDARRACDALVSLGSGKWSKTGTRTSCRAALDAIALILSQPEHQAIDDALNGHEERYHPAFVKALLATADPDLIKAVTATAAPELKERIQRALAAEASGP